MAHQSPVSLELLTLMWPKKIILLQWPPLVDSGEDSLSSHKDRGTKILIN